MKTIALQGSIIVFTVLKSKAWSVYRISMWVWCIHQCENVLKNFKRFEKWKQKDRVKCLDVILVYRVYGWKMENKTHQTNEKNEHPRFQCTRFKESPRFVISCSKYRKYCIETCVHVIEQCSNCCNRIHLGEKTACCKKNRIAKNASVCPWCSACGHFWFVTLGWKWSIGQQTE